MYIYCQIKNLDTLFFKNYSEYPVELRVAASTTPPAYVMGAAVQLQETLS